MQDTVYVKAKKIGLIAEQKGFFIATAESCTGGMLAEALTKIKGASKFFERGFVTYSNKSKIEMLGVSEENLIIHGAVSAEVATEMAVGALNRSQADCVISITGIAGPDGGTSEKPVGLVYFACGRRDGKIECYEERFGHLSRDRIRKASTLFALDLIYQALETEI